MTPQSLALLLRDTSALLRPPPVRVLAPSADDLAAHPSAALLLALSDLSALFSGPSAPPSSAAPAPAKPSAAAHKLAFYAAHAARTPPAVLRMLADEAVLRAEVVAREGGGAGASGGAGAPPRAGGVPGEVKRPVQAQAEGRPKIEELA